MKHAVRLLDNVQRLVDQTRVEQVAWYDETGVGHFIVVLSMYVINTEYPSRTNGLMGARGRRG